MGKSKVKLKESKKEYLWIAVGILLILFCLLLLGRVGQLSKIFLFITFIFGDFTSLLLVIVVIVSLLNLILKKKIDFQHIFFIGGVLIFIGVSLFCHLGLYEPLNMTNKTILTKTVDLYSRYLNNYERSYSCGGGIIIALIAQVIGIVSGKIGIMLVAACFLIIGFSYVIDIDIVKILKAGKFKTVALKSIKKVFGFFKNIHYPKRVDKVPKIPISILQDNGEPVTFTLQEQINKDTYNNLSEYISRQRISCILSENYTSYTSSRFVIKIPHKSQMVESELTSYFNKNCFLIKNGLDINIEVPNQFKKLLTLKNVLVSHSDKNRIVLGVDIDNSFIDFDITSGKILCIIGEHTSGVKTFIRGFLSSLLIKGILQDNIYFYDLYNEFPILNNTKIHYMNNERSAAIGLEEAFSEYERRVDAFKYLNVDNIEEANKKIEEMGDEYSPMKTVFQIFFFNPTICDSSLIQKLSYVMQFGIKVGMIVILILRDRQSLYKFNLSNCDMMSFYNSDISASIKIFGSDIACRLQKKGDILYQSKNKILHGQSPYISLDDFENIINHL